MLRRLRRGRVAALMVATMALALVAAACGDDSGDYPSQNFRWVVPYSAGGGFDTYSRGFAEVMAENQLPGGVEIGVENITPIAEGLSTAFGGDEYTLAMLPMPAASAQQVLFPDIAKWDVEEFTVLGSIEEIRARSGPPSIHRRSPPPWIGWPVIENATVPSRFRPFETATRSCPVRPFRCCPPRTNRLMAVTR